MVSVYQLKPAFQTLLDPLLPRLRRAGFTPNRLTLASLGVSTLSGAAVVASAWVHSAFLVFVPLGLFLRMAFNALDGMMARKYGLESVQGALLNEVVDVVSDLVVVLPFALFASSLVGPVVLFTLLFFLSEFVGVLGTALRGERRNDGPMGKSDRALAMGLLALVLAMAPAVRLVQGYFAILSILSAFTIGRRGTRIWRGN